MSTRKRVSIDELEDDLYEQLDDIELQIEEAEKEADRMGCTVKQIKNMNGEFLLTPLLVARSQALLGLAHLQVVKANAKT